MRFRMLFVNGKMSVPFSTVAIVAVLSFAITQAGTASAQHADSGVQQCSCNLLKGIWSGYGSGKDRGCDECQPNCGCEEPTCGCEPATCGCEQPACGAEPVCDGGCDAKSGCDKKSGCCLLSGGSGLLSKFKSKMTTMLKPKSNDCQCCQKAAPCGDQCGCGGKKNSHIQNSYYRHSEPQQMFVPPAPMIVAPVAPNDDIDPTLHEHLDESALPAPKADSINDPFRDDSVRVRRTAVPQRHAPVGHLESTSDKIAPSDQLRPAVYQQSATGDRWSAPLFVAPVHRK